MPLSHSVRFIGSVMMTRPEAIVRAPVTIVPRPSASLEPLAKVGYRGSSPRRRRRPPVVTERNRDKAHGSARHMPTSGQRRHSPCTTRRRPSWCPYSSTGPQYEPRHLDQGRLASGRTQSYQNPEQLEFLGTFSLGPEY